MRHVYVLLKRLGLALVLYSLLRICFVAFNWHTYARMPVSEIAGALLAGLRFDLSSILIINSPLILLSLVPLVVKEWAGYQKFLRALFVMLNVPFFAANVSDIEYYKFTGKRMTQDVFALQGEFAHQVDQFLVNYWHLFLLVFALAFVSYRYFPRLKPVSNPSLHRNWFTPIKEIVVMLTVVALAVVGMRGGIQLKVLQPANAFAQGRPELATLTLNSSFTLIKSKNMDELEKRTDFANREDVLKVIHPQASRSRLKDDERGPGDNVVILILESLATEFWGAANPYKGYTPFLDQLAQEGLFFPYNFANGRRSIEALPSIFFGLPSLMSAPLVKSAYYGNDLRGIGSVLKEQGYYTSFFHGAPLGTMYFDMMAKRAGFEKHHSLETYNNPDDFDGNWGIFDEPMLQYMVKELSLQHEPFLSAAFTISTHQPYSLPEKYIGQFPEGTLDIHKNIGYLDYSVQKFFEAAQKEPWYENTLFIITADHTQMSESENYNSNLGRFRVPLLLFHPKKNLSRPQADSRITQHADIYPTILDYLGLKDHKHMLFGRSVFSGEPGVAVNHLAGNYWLVHKDHFIEYHPEQGAKLFDLHKDTDQNHPLVNQPALLKKYQEELKAYIQYFHNGLINDDLYEW